MNTRKPRFGCDFCSKRCVTEMSLRVHKRAVHLSEGVLCPYCSIILPSNLLTQHVSSCKAVDVNTSDALLHYGYSGMEENYLNDLPTRLTELRYVAVDWDSLIAHSRPEPAESEQPPAADYAPYIGASDDDYAEPLDMGDDGGDGGRPEAEHAAGASETSPVSEAENLRAGWTTSPCRTHNRSLNRSSLSALQRMLGVKRRLLSLKPNDAAPDAAGPTKARAKRRPDKGVTGKARKRARFSKKVTESSSSSDENEEVDRDRELREEDRGARKEEAKKNKAAKEPLKSVSDDDDAGNLVIDLEAQTDSSPVKEPRPQKKTDGEIDGKMAKKTSQKRKRSEMMNEMKQLVAESEKALSEKKSKERKRNVKARGFCALPVTPKGKKIDLDSSDETEGNEGVTGGRKCKLAAKKKIRNIKDNSDDSYSVHSDSSSNSEHQSFAEVDVDFVPQSVPSSDSEASNDSHSQIDLDKKRSRQVINDEYDSDCDFGFPSCDRSLIQSTIPCPAGASAVASSTEAIGAPFASLFLCYVVDPKGSEISPPLPGAAALPNVRFENEDDIMRSFMWTCECCGLVKNSRETKESHLRAVHRTCCVRCAFCRAAIPFSLYAVHTWLLCPKILRLYPQDLAGPHSFPCEFCNGFFVTTCPLYYLRHVIMLHSNIVNALSLERAECSRCRGSFHKAFLSVHDFICRIASEMNVALSHLTSYHVDIEAVSNLGRPIPSIPSSQQKIYVKKLSAPKASQKKCKIKLRVPPKPNPSVVQLVQNRTIHPKPLPPVKPKTSKNQPAASNPHSFDDDVMEILDIPSSPEPTKKQKVKSQTKVNQKKRRWKHDVFSSIFLENIFEPSSPPSSPKPDDTLETDDALDSSKDFALEDSIFLNDVSNDVGLSLNKTDDGDLEESHGHEGVENCKQIRDDEEVILRVSAEPTEACSHTDHATMTRQQRTDDGVSNQDQQPSETVNGEQNDRDSEQDGGVTTKQQRTDDGVSNQDQQPNETVNGEQNDNSEPKQDGDVIEASKKKDNGSEVVIVNVKMCHKKNICEFCGKGTDLVPEYQAHKQKHKGGVRCPLCLTLLPRSLLLCHRRLFCPTLHKNVTWSLQCDLCQKAIPSPFHLLRHALDWHKKHVTKTPGQRPAADEPPRQRCEHCAAPVRPLFFDCHQEMCFRKLQFEMKARPLAKKPPPAPNHAEAPDATANTANTAETPSGTDASDSNKVVEIAESSDVVDNNDGANGPETADVANVAAVTDSPAAAAAATAAAASEPSEVACDGESADTDVPADVLCNAVTAEVVNDVTAEVVNDFGDTELVDAASPVRRSESNVAPPIAVSNGFEAGLSTPPHTPSEDVAANSNLDQGVMDFGLLMDDTIPFGTGSSSNSLRMSSTPPEQRETARLASFEREVSGEAAGVLSVTASDATLFEDISEVLEAVMHENGQQNQL